MTPNATDTIRRHADGSIDADVYLARGRAARSRHAHDLLAALGERAIGFGSKLRQRLGPADPADGLHCPMRPRLG